MAARPPSLIADGRTDRKMNGKSDGAYPGAVINAASASKQKTVKLYRIQDAEMWMRKLNKHRIYTHYRGGKTSVRMAVRPPSLIADGGKMNGKSDGAYPGAVINAASASEPKTVKLYRIQDAVVWMLELNKNGIYTRYQSGEKTYIFEGLPQKLEEALADSVEVGEFRLILAGFEFRNPLNAYGADKAMFPREAYYQWWKKNEHGLPCPAWFDDLRKADEALEADKCNDEVDERQGAQPLTKDQVSDIRREEIVPGVTVDAIRAMLNKDSPAYCPRLLAAVMTKIAIMPREEKDAQGFTELPAAKESAYKNAVAEESVEHLRSVGVVSCTDGSKNPDPAKEDIASVCRILWRTPGGKPGRPKKPVKVLSQ